MTLFGNLIGSPYAHYFGLDHWNIFGEIPAIAFLILIPMLLARRLVLHCFAFMEFGTTHLTLAQRLAVNERHFFLRLLDHATNVFTMITLGLYLPLVVLVSPY